MTIVKLKHDRRGRQIHFVQARRVGVESDLDFAIYLSSAGPVSIDRVTDLQRFVNDQIAPDVKVGAFVFQEAKVHEGILPE